MRTSRRAGTRANAVETSGHRVSGMKASLHIAQDPTADEVLSTDAFALLIGMLLDQRSP